MKKTKDIANFEEFLDGLMVYMLTIKMDTSNGKFNRIPLSTFSPAQVLCDDERVDNMKNLDHAANEANIHHDAKLKDVLDIGIDHCYFKNANPELAPGYKYQVTRYRLLPHKETRGFHFNGRNTVKLSTGLIKPDGKLCAGHAFFVQHGANWLEAAPAEGMEKKYIEDKTEHMGAILGLIFRDQYKWSVSIGYHGYPALRFYCDPEGARSIFKLRDIPEGKSRRAALKHWVGEHMRSTPNNDSDDYIHVLEYLRGQTTFDWNGMRCQIHPSLDDIKRYKLHHPNGVGLIK